MPPDQQETHECHEPAQVPQAGLQFLTNQEAKTDTESKAGGHDQALKSNIAASHAFQPLVLKLLRVDRLAIVPAERLLRQYRDSKLGQAPDAAVSADQPIDVNQSSIM